MNLRFLRRLLPILAGLVVLTGFLIGLGSYAQANDRVPPVLINMNPEPNTCVAGVNGSIQATYDQDMDPATVTYQTFAIHGMQTGWLTETLAVQGGTIMLTPTINLHPGELVQVSATTANLSLGGEAPAQATVWQFMTEVSAGSGTFLKSNQQLGYDDNRALALGDLDGDGDIDVVVGGFAGSDKVYFNDGNGVFTYSGQMFGGTNTMGLVLGDLDGDGDLDIFESRSNGLSNRVWWNDGQGMFSDSGQNLGSSYSFVPALGDVDGDGDLDVFVANGRQGSGGAGQPNEVYINNGSGIFTDSGQDLGLMKSIGVALADLDGDGDLDAFVVNGGNYSEPNRVWFNDGSGVFTDSGQALGNGRSMAVVLGDLDGDGDVDAFVTNRYLSAGGEPDEVWLNDGSGVFTLGHSLGSLPSGGAALGDMDGDGDLDLLVCQNSSIIWINDGSANFSQSGRRLGNCLLPGLGDLDGDGDLDAFLANTALDGPYPNEVWFNMPLIEQYLPFVGQN